MRLLPNFFHFYYHPRRAYRIFIGVPSWALLSIWHFLGDVKDLWKGSPKTKSRPIQYGDKL